MQVDTAPSTPPGSGSDLGNDSGQLSRYLGAVRRRWPILAACIVIGALIGAVTTQSSEAGGVGGGSSKQYYKATHTIIADSVFIAPDASSSSSGNSSQTNLSQAAFLVTTGEVPVRTAAKLGIPVDVVLTTVEAVPRSDVSSVEVSAYAATPEEAVRLADAAATELMAYLGETATARYNKQRDDILAKLDDLKRQRTIFEQQLAITPVEQRPTRTPELDSVINQYTVTYEQFTQLSNQGLPSSGFRTIQAATAVPITLEQFTAAKDSILQGGASGAKSTTTTTVAKASAASTQPAGAAVRAGAGAFLGLLLGVTIVLLLDRFDTRLRRRETVEAATGLAVLSEIPPLDRKAQHNTRILAAAEPRSSTAEAYRVVRTAMVFARAADAKSDTTGQPDQGTVVMVTSPSPGEGKTTSVANLAAVFAEGGQSVLVIDCDFRRPRIHKYLADDHALTSAINSNRESSAIVAANGKLKALASDIEGVRLVTGMGEAFPDANPIEIVAYQREVIRFARQHFDIVLLDTAPFLTTNDASELLEDTDVVFLVVRSGKTQFAAARRAAEFLTRLGAPVLGVIVTASADASAAQYYYHYYLETEGTSRRRKQSEPPEATSAPNGNSRSRANGTNGTATRPSPAVDDDATENIFGRAALDELRSKDS